MDANQSGNTGSAKWVPTRAPTALKLAYQCLFQFWLKHTLNFIQKMSELNVGDWGQYRRFVFFTGKQTSMRLNITWKKLFIIVAILGVTFLIIFKNTERIKKAPGEWFFIVALHTSIAVNMIAMTFKLRNAVLRFQSRVRKKRKLWCSLCRLVWCQYQAFEDSTQKMSITFRMLFSANVKWKRTIRLISIFWETRRCHVHLW